MGNLSIYFQKLINLYPFGRGRGLIMRIIPKFLTSNVVDGETFFGAKMHLNLRDRMQWEIFSTGVWEYPETKALELKLKPGTVFYDIGANIGYFSLLASSHIGRHGLVVAIEPSPKNYSVLLSHLKVNKIQNVKTYQCGLSDKNHSLTLNQHIEEGAQSTFLDHVDSGERYEIRLTTLDELIETHNLPKPNLIKIDVEGMELEVIRGMVKTLKSCRKISVLVEITGRYMRSRDLNELEIYNILFRCGFTMAKIVSTVEFEWNGEKDYQLNLLLEKC